MAIVSKAVFEKTARNLAVGDTWPTDRYVSQKLTPLAGGGALYLVTVRPGDVLWLVGILTAPTFDGTQWTAAANATPIRDISAWKPRLRFANGQGLPTEPGRLGMSLQTARVLTDDDVALLTDATVSTRGAKPAGKSTSTKSTSAKLARGSSSTSISTAPARSAKSSATSARSAKSTSTKTARGATPPTDLEAARDELRAGNSERALALLVDAWAEVPDPRLAEVILALSAEARTPAPANLRGKTAAARAAWDAYAAKATAADIPMLLESLCDVSSGDAVERLAVVERWMPDPRIEKAFVDILGETPYRATSTKPFWMGLFALAARMRDPGQQARLATLDFAGVAVTMGEWLKGKTAKLVAAIVPAELVGEPIVEEIAALVGGRRAAGAAERADIEHLFRAVYDAPEDDGPRVVLADALIERNDPRGELINVQLALAADAGDRALKARERELLEAHGKAWLGELAPILMAEVKFERGFLAACKIDNSQLDRVQKLVGNAAWSTVRSLEGSALIALDPVMRSLRRLVFRQSNARRHEGLADAWRDLLIDTPRAIEELQYESMHSERQWLDTVEGRRQVRISDQSEVDALCTCRALPKLRRLALRDNPVLFVGKLANAEVLERLEHLGFLYDRNNRLDEQRASALVDFAPILAGARVPELRFEIGGFHETELVLERGGKGYERARMTLGPTMKSNWSHQLVDEAIRMLDSLPRTLRELRITTRKWTETQQVARLRAAATQMKLDVCEVA